MSKYLHFANSEVCDLKELTNDEALNRYIPKLESSGIGPDGIVSKLDRITNGLRYLAYLARHDVEDSSLRRIRITIKQN